MTRERVAAGVPHVCGGHGRWCAGATVAAATLRDYDRSMRSLPTILMILSFPAGAIAYVVATRILSSLALPDGVGDFLVLIAPLFVAGLVMVPFLIPYFDRKAKADLAEYRRTTASAPVDAPARADGAASPAGDAVELDDPVDPTAST